MTDLTKPQTIKIQHYGTVPAQKSKEKKVFLQSLRKPKPPSKPAAKLLELGAGHRRDRATAMSFPREFIRGIHQFAQSINGHTIDSTVFRLNTNATVILLVTFSLAVTTRQYVGHAIDCVHARDIPEDVLNTYCWIHSTFTVVTDAGKKDDTVSELSSSGIQTSGKRPIRQFRYYQWVEFSLFLQRVADALGVSVPTIRKMAVKKVYKTMRVCCCNEHCLYRKRALC